MFLYINVKEFDNYFFDFQCSSNHASLSFYIIIEEEFIQEKKLAIVKNSKEEKEFINELKDGVISIEMANIHSHEVLEIATQKFTSIFKELCIRNRPATEPVTLKVCNVKLSFDIWLIIFMYFILYF